MTKNFYKSGAVIAIVGSVLSFIGNVLHPRPSDITQFSSHLLDTAQNDPWFGIHLAILLSLVIVMWGMVVIADSLKQNDNVWARLAGPTVIMSTAVAVVFMGIDGYGLKLAADLWNSAQGPLKDLYFQTGVSLDILDRSTFFVWILTSFGFVPFVFGLAMFKNLVYPKWLAYVSLVMGVVGMVSSCIMFIGGPTNNLVVVSVTDFLLFTIWTILVGVLLWRRADRIAS